MIKSNLNSTLLLPLILVITMSAVHSRFLQTANLTRTQDGGASSTPSSYFMHRTLQATTWNADLNCGECLLGNYIYCLKGPDGMVVDTSTKVVDTCCKDTASCQTYLKDPAWNCSNKYTDDVERYKVCPFIKDQCGDSPDINLSGVGDAHCHKTKNLKKGNACLFKVQSKCGVPNFLLNDTNATNVVFKQKMISNITINSTTPAVCNVVYDRSCLCVPGSKAPYLSCSCLNQQNITLNTTQCKCTTATDSAGNTIQDCVCSIVTPVQVYFNQTCNCSKAVNPTTKASYLNCNCSSALNRNPKTNVPMDEKSCKQQGTIYTCTNVPQCPAPDTSVSPVQQLPCNDSFNCSCVSKGSSWQCDCDDSKTKLKGTKILPPTNNCSCTPVINGKTWSQQCGCCLSTFYKRLFFTPSLFCPVGALKEKCTCANLTQASNSSYACNCSHPQNNVKALLPNITAPSCECDVFDGKQCNCCVSYDTQAVQLQPACTTTQTKQKCGCTNVTSPNGWSYLCGCTNVQNNFTLAGMLMPTSQCYCHPMGGNVKDCNCCASADAVQTQLQPPCTGISLIEPCQCSDPGSGFLGCNCTHPVTSLKAQSLNLKSNLCYCPPSTNANNKTCNCCISYDIRLVTQLQPVCTNNATRQVCDKCSAPFNNKGTWGLSCDCANSVNNVTVSQTFINAERCYCNPNNTKACNCCVSFDDQVIQLQPKCDLRQQKQKCTCNDTALSTTCNCTHANTSAVVSQIPMPKGSCYCLPSLTTIKACNCCSSFDTQVIQMQPKCDPTDEKQNCSCAVGKNAANYDCQCTNPNNNFTATALSFNANTDCYCGLGMKSCNCCVTFDTRVFQLQPKVPKNFDKQGCQCENTTVKVGTTTTYVLKCNCANNQNKVNAPGLVMNTADCYCQDSLVGKKFCNCTVAPEIQVAQLQPICSKSDKQPCYCTATTDAKTKQQVTTCNCTKETINTTTTVQNVKAQDCYCNSTTLLNTFCNCCVSYSDQVRQMQPKCQGAFQSQSCQCSNETDTKIAKGSLGCTCTHPTTATDVSGLVIANQSCYCDNVNKGNKACNCCVSFDMQEVQLQPKCSGKSMKQLCNCTKLSPGYNCSCLNPTSGNLGNPKPTLDQCYCSNITKACNCCVSDSVILDQMQPICDATSKKLNTCQCYVLKNNQNSCNCTDKDATVYRNMTLANKACYCDLSTLGDLKACNCCANPADIKQGLKLMCLADTTNTSCKCKNVTVGKVSSLQCDCINKQFWNVNVKNVTFDNKFCDCFNNTDGSLNCSCCSNQNQLINKVTCVAGQNQSSCMCTNFTDAKTKKPAMTCNCNSNSNQAIPVQLKNFAVDPLNQCGCSNQTDNGVTSLVCDCCITTANWTTARPQCQGKTSQQACNCTNVTTVVKGVNTSSWNCNCSNKEMPTLPLRNIQFTPKDCGCDITNLTNKTCDCCVDQSTKDTLFLNNRTCPANNTLANCTCNPSGKDGLVCDCKDLTTNVSYSRNELKNTSCNCIDKNCRCCLTPRIDFVLPSTTYQCSSIEQSQYCECATVADSKTKLMPCNCTNRTTGEILRNLTDTKGCSCITATNSDKTSATLCNCCRSTPLKCGATDVAQDCTCRNASANALNCSCTRKDNGIRANLTKDNGFCRCPINSNNCSCCITPKEYADQIPRLYCDATDTKIGCTQCQIVGTNPVTKEPQRVCTCVRSDTTISGMFSFGSSQCLCPTNTSTACDCCVSADKMSQLVPQPKCNATIHKEEVCKCGAFAGGKYDCQCLRNDTGVTSPLSITNQSLCGCVAGNCRCCVTDAQLATQFLKAKCTTTQAEQNCSCSASTTDPKTKLVQQTCNCYRNDTGIWKSFVNNASSCVCNSIYCSCCMNKDQVDQQIFCQLPTLQQPCACKNASATGKYDCQCTRVETNITKAFTYDKKDCQCTGTNCGCCSTQTQRDTQVFCDKNTYEQFCPCQQTSTGAWKCNCLRADTNVTKALDLTATQCRQWKSSSQCCLSKTQYDSVVLCTPDQKMESCNCQNGVFNTSTNTFNQDCWCNRPDKNVFTNFTFPGALCQTNGASFNCCLSKAQYDSQSFCPAKDRQQQGCNCTTLKDSKGNSYLNCSCLRVDTKVTKAFAFSPYDCQCNGPNCTCCVNRDQINNQTLCATNTTRQDCTCNNLYDTFKKQGYYNCNCTNANTRIAKNFNFTQPGCGCIGNDCDCCLTIQQTQQQDLCYDTNNKHEQCTCKNVTDPKTKIWSWDCSCMRPDTFISKQFALDAPLCAGNAADGYTCCIVKASYDQQVLCPSKDYVEQQCTSCKNTTVSGKTVTNCKCTRGDTRVDRDFSIDQSLCQCNGANCKCCVNPTQVSSQFFCLNKTIQESCKCNNVFGQYNCNCTKPDDTKYVKAFNFTQDLCQANGTQTYNCCVSQQQYDYQVAPLVCPAQSVNQKCACKQIVDPKTKLTSFDCTCQRPDTGYTKAFSFGSSLCQCINDDCSCCLTPVQLATQNITCNVVKEQLQGCQCLNVTNTTTKKWAYSCNCTRPDTGISAVFGLEQPSCNYIGVNGPVSKCCILFEQLDNQLPKFTCPAIKDQQTCSCIQRVNATTGKYFYSCNCTRDFTKSTKLINYNSTSDCQCGYNMSKCKCCVDTTVQRTQMECTKVNSTQSSCTCKNTTYGKTWNYTCDCVAQRYINVFNVKANDYGQQDCICDGTKCDCCVTYDDQKASVLPTCKANTFFSICNCSADSQSGCNCTTTFAPNINLREDNIQITKSGCGCYNESINGQNFVNCSCCKDSTSVNNAPERTCALATQSPALCSCNATNATGWRGCNCDQQLSTSVTYVNKRLNISNNDCQCNTVTSASSTRQLCTCCADKFLPKAPKCALNFTSDVCECTTLVDPVFKINYQSCNCTKKNGTTTLQWNGLDLGMDQCGCENAIVGKRSFQNCSCCVPPPPPPFCEQAAAQNTSNLNCTCEQAKSGVMNCNCSAKVNTTTTLKKDGMALKSTSCCCAASKFLPASQQLCNCIQEPTPTNHTCTCKSAIYAFTNTPYWNCQCQDCNNWPRERNMSVSDCQCLGGSGKPCTCQVPYRGICPPTPIIVNEDSCSAKNKPYIWNVTGNNETNCKWEYEYLVAIVAAGKDSIVLMELQSYQLSAYYLKSVFATTLLLLTYLLY